MGIPKARRREKRTVWIRNGPRKKEADAVRQDRPGTGKKRESVSGQSIRRYRLEDSRKEKMKMILAEKIITLRKRMNWSQEELAEKLDISRQSVSKWEVGATIPDLDKILKMSELFGVSTDYLLKDEMDVTELTGGKDMPEGRVVSVEEANAYMDTARKSAAGSPRRFPFLF